MRLPMGLMLKASHQNVCICNGAALISFPDIVLLHQRILCACVSLIIPSHPFENWPCLLHAVITSGWLSVSSIQN